MAVYQLEVFERDLGLARTGGYPSKDVVEAELFGKANCSEMRKWIAERPLPRGTKADQVDALRASNLLEMDPCHAAEDEPSRRHADQASDAWRLPAAAAHRRRHVHLRAIPLQEVV